VVISRRSVFPLIAFLLAASTVTAQGTPSGVTASIGATAPVASVSAPVMGYFFDGSRNVLQSITGIPGSGFPGTATPLNATLVEISPAQDYALAVLADSGSAAVVTLDGSGSPPVPLAGAMSGVSLIAISPTGTTALLFSAGSGAAQIFTGLPQSPSLARQLDWSALPGNVTALAVDDAGDLALVVAQVGNAVLYAVSGGSAPSAIFGATSVASVKFFPDSRQALAAAPVEQQVIFVQDNGGVPGISILADARIGLSAPQAVAASQDGSRAYVLDGSGVIFSIPLSGGQPAQISCGCAPQQLQRMRGRDVFLLTPSLAAPPAVLDAGGDSMRVVLMPVEPPASAHDSGGNNL